MSPDQLGKTRRLTCLLSVLLFVQPLRSQDVEITDLQVQNFERFWRVVLFIPTEPAYTIEDSSAAGFITVMLQAVPQRLFITPEDSEIRVALSSSDSTSHLRIGMNHRFRFDAFYFSQGRRLIIDLYPDRDSPELVNSFRAGMQAIQRGDTTAAVKYFNAAIAGWQNPADAHYQLGTIYYYSALWQKAKAHFESALEAGLPYSLVKIYLENIARREALQTVARPPLPMQENPATADTLQPEAADTAQAAEDHRESARTVSRVDTIIVAKRRTAKNQLVLFFERVRSLDTDRLSIAAGLAALALALVFTWLVRKKKALRAASKGRPRRNRFWLWRWRSPRRAPAGSAKRRASSRSSEDTASAQSHAGHRRETAADGNDFINLVQSATQKLASQRRKHLRVSEEDRRSHGSSTAENSGQENRFSPSLRNEIRRMAMDGLSVREIARELGMGVGEVELLLDLLQQSTPAVTASRSDSRIDFSF